MTRPIVAAAIAVLAAAPAAAWGNDPISEPSSALDRPEWMWPTPNDRAQLAGGAMPDRLYFNAQLSANEIATLPQAPGGRMPPVIVSAEAFLGYWRDCNNDGYVGNRLTGQTKYVAATATLDLAVCPPGSAFNPGSSISAGPIYGLVRPMVYEFIQVGDERGYLDNTPVPYSLHDPAARVWGDVGLPTERARATPATYPFPTDVWDSWNAHFAYVDALTFGRASTTYGRATTGLPVTVAPTMYDTPLSAAPTPLSRVRGLYSQESRESPDGRPLVAIWECNPASPRADPTLAPRADPDGSVFDSLNNTMKGATVVIPRAPPATPGARVQLGQGCDGPANGGVLADGLGQPVVLDRKWVTNTASKATTDFVFVPTPPFQEPRHQTLPWALIRHNGATGAWFTRDPQLMDASDARNAHYFTFYAKVGAAGLTGRNSGAPSFTAPGAIALPGARVVAGEVLAPAFVYGAEACAPPRRLGWDCSNFGSGLPSPEWERLKDPRFGATLGETYQLRDTDCVDLTPALGAETNAAKDDANFAWNYGVTAIFNRNVPEDVGHALFPTYCV